MAIDNRAAIGHHIDRAQAIMLRQLSIVGALDQLQFRQAEPMNAQ
jgi:hypothetical protein